MMSFEVKLIEVGSDIMINHQRVPSMRIQDQKCLFRRSFSEEWVRDRERLETGKAVQRWLLMSLSQ